MLPTIFEPFRRGDDSAQGLGLGLYIVREIARAHGGNATVSSSEAAGTPFRLSLPKSATAQHDCLVVDAYEKGSPHSQQPGEYLWARAVQLVTLRRAARVRDGPFCKETDVLKIKLAVAALALCSAPAFADPTACVVAGAAEGGGGNRPFAAARDQPDREYATFEKATHRGVTFYLRAGHGVIRLEAWQGKKRLASTFSSSGRNPPAADSLTLEVAGPTGSVEAQCSGIAAATTSVPAR